MKNIAFKPEDLLIIVDMQEDFVGGSLGTKEAQAIVPGIADLVAAFPGKVIFTQDTHSQHYLSTQEGRNLAVPHCIHMTPGWHIVPQLQDRYMDKSGNTSIILKDGFGSMELADIIRHRHYEDIYFCGVCTGICVISNAVIAKSADTESRIHILSELCACVTPETHRTALDAMKLLQMDII